MNTASERTDPRTDRWVMLRDLGVLQLKLLIDGLRDLLLVPASIIAGIASLVASEDGRPGPQFYRLLTWGKASELWINLFGALRNSPEKIQPTERFGNRDIDDFVGKLESLVVDEVKRGGLTSQAKVRFEKVLDALRRKSSS